MTTITATVIGAGSVGPGMAASLAIAGQRVTLLTRVGFVAALAGSPITVGGSISASPRPPARRSASRLRIGW